MPTTEILISSAGYAVVLGFLLFLTAQPLMGILQQEGYSGVALVEWWFKKRNMLAKRFALLCLCSALIGALLSLCFSFGGSGVSVMAAMAGYAVLLVVFVYAFRHALKVPLKRTKRILRLSAAFYLVIVLAFYAVEVLMSVAATAIGHPLAEALLCTVPVTFIPALLPYLLAAAGAIMKLYEVPHTQKFVRRAAATLKESPCLKVGITGSFGKTSVKQFAAAMLSERFRVLATPASYNTPAGIASFVNGQGADCDVFLAEMGARKRGDIKELCDMVCPSVAVVTGICPQHLETFGSLDAIWAEKGVLAQRAENVVLGRSASDLKENALVEGRDFFAENISLTREGTSFDLVLGGERHAVRTRLMGRHAAEDVALAGALCYLLGMPPADIAKAAESLEPIPHRLAHLTERGLDILDDSYNSNVEGAKDAVETLRLFGGKRYVVTPGLVELGELEEDANAALGASLVGLDCILLVGETRVLAVRQGYLDAGGDEKAVQVVPDLEAAKAQLYEALSPGDAVLFLNDLPDKYV